MKASVFLILFTSFTIQAQIQFESGTWDEVLNRAKSEDKLIFLDAYATWCEPCKLMEEYTFSDLEVGNFFNKNFINIRLDMEQYPGVELAEKYSVGVYPSLLFINSEGQIVHRGCGSIDASQFLDLGSVALNDTSNLIYYESGYESGERTPDFMVDYLDLLESSCLNAELFASQFLEGLGESELASSTGWAVLAAYQWDIYSREFQYLLNNKELFEDSVGLEPVNAKIYDTYLTQYQEVYASDELHDFGMRSLIHSLSQVSFSGADTLKTMMSLHYAEYKENWKSFADYAIELVGMMDISDPEELSELAWKFYLFVDDRKKLEIADSWAKQAVDLLPDPSIIDTYASLQYKLGNKKKAIELEKRALELANEMYEDVSHYEYQLSKFEGS